MALRRAWRRSLLFGAFTAIFVGYFMVWLPHTSAGLSFIGLEMGEQAKFLPQVQSGAILPGRSLFYVPPVTLGLMLILVSLQWPRGRAKTWATRLLGVAISLLAFPALEALGTEAAEWLWRVLMIALVFLVAIVGTALAPVGDRVIWLLVGLMALVGVILPTWVYLAVRGAFAQLLPRAPGIGPGLWLNAVGHLAVFLLAVLQLGQRRRQKKPGQRRTPLAL